jgi:hypothetical protein
MAGMPLPAIAVVLGHTTTRMGELHYSHFAPGWVCDYIRATPLGIGAGEETEKVAVLRPGG